MANEETQVVEEQVGNETPLSESEKEQLQELIQTNQALNQAFGSLSIRKIQLEDEESMLKEQLAANLSKEKEITQKINSKYGNGAVDLQRGVFTPTEG
mgnify:FL=1